MAEIKVNQKVNQVEGTVAGIEAGSHAAASGIKADVNQEAGTVSDGGVVVGEVIGSDKGHTHVGGKQQYHNVIDTGGAAYIGGNVTVGGNFAGRDMVTYGNANTGADLNAIFAPFLATVQTLAGENSAAAGQKVAELKAEAAKGKQPDDSVLAGLVQDLVDLVPSAVSAVGSIFASPLLAALVGPATKFVLKRLGL